MISSTNSAEGFIVPGSGALSFMVGYGAGQSKMRCTFTIIDLAHPNTPLFVLRSEGDSGMSSENLYLPNEPRADLERTINKLRGYFKNIIQ